MTSDRAERQRAIDARQASVWIDAGAGAGKTSLLVSRILALVAPPDDATSALSLGRIAAVTFTRRAAGELRIRIRERLLAELTRPQLSALRKDRLHQALGSLDTALVGTIHSFADRMLRMQPMKARLSPSYEIAEELDDLIEETFGRLLHAVQHGTLVAELSELDAAYVAEVERTLQESMRAGMLVRSVDRDPAPPKVGLDALVRAFIEQRDRELTTSETVVFDRETFIAEGAALLAELDRLDDDARPGTRWLLRLRGRLRDAIASGDPLVAYELVSRIEQGKRRFRPTIDFVRKSPASQVFARLKKEGADRLLAPLHAFMARRMARTRHVVIALYDRVKANRQMVDSIDLLLTLHNLLRDDLTARAFYQAQLDHVFVDELQDTDPLQAEIVLYLSEATPSAHRWQDVVVGPGRLTLVGDPKQSIYRFRRADVGMYDRLREQVMRSDHVAITLSANFRSVTPLVTWVNARFAEVLGTSPDRIFDPATGRVFHQPQLAARTTTAPHAVHAVPYAFRELQKPAAADLRSLEGRALASYLRQLVDGGRTIEDPDTGAQRPIRWSDVAVLALVTTNVPRLFTALDEALIPYAMAGGTLFARDPLHAQFLLALRAIADRHDGVAEAALLRAPFFEIDLRDLVHERANLADEHAARATAARTWLRDVRAQRHARSPGATARMLLEQTGIGRVAALGPNGEQRLAHLRELCLALELLAADQRLDYDGATAQLREWIAHPPKLDPPRPVGSEAIQVLTVHQAKGLEFPVVVLWDGMGMWDGHEKTVPWRVDRDGTGWSMKTNDMTWEEPPGNALLAMEKSYAEAERARLVYVAATRARDLLVIPEPKGIEKPQKYIHATLLAGDRDALVETLPTFFDDSPSPSASRPTPRTVDDDAAWSAQREAALKPRLAPRSVTALAKGDLLVRIDDEELPGAEPRVIRVARHGPLFGDVVHRAIGLTLSRRLPAPEAVEQAARMLGLASHLDEAVLDVQRAVTALEAAGLLGPREVRLEYAVAGARDGQLVSGFIDFLSAGHGDVVVLDFKTDRWPRGIEDVTVAFPAYVAQVRTYAALIGAQRSALLFTSTGRLAWTPGPAELA